AGEGVPADWSCSRPSALPRLRGAGCRSHRERVRPCPLPRLRGEGCRVALVARPAVLPPPPAGRGGGRIGSASGRAPSPACGEGGGRMGSASGRAPSPARGGGLGWRQAAPGTRQPCPTPPPPPAAGRGGGGGRGSGRAPRAAPRGGGGGGGGAASRPRRLASMTDPLPTIRLRNAWRSSHPWIFQRLVEKPAQRVKPGSIVDIVG